MDLFSDLGEPTEADLAEIERQMPLIGAEVDLVDAQIIAVPSPVGPSELDWQRIRRAQRRVLREARELLTAHRAIRWTA